MKVICLKKRKDVQRNMDKGLPPSYEFQDHMQSCDSCRKFYRGLKAVNRRIKELSKQHFGSAEYNEDLEYMAIESGRTGRKVLWRTLAYAAVFLILAVPGALLVLNTVPSGSESVISETANSMVSEEISASVEYIMTSSFSHETSYSVAKDIAK